jgi:hypothetical protein
MHMAGELGIIGKDRVFGFPATAGGCAEILETG